MGGERFDVFMERCLYGADGFYSTGRGSAGRRRDFITSPEIGPLFGAVLARALDGYWREVGCPDPFPVVDFGAGPQTLAKSLELASPQCSSVWKLVSLDRADGPDAEWPNMSNGVIIANELLDNLSFRIVEQTSDGLREVWIVDGVEELRPTDLDIGLGPGLRAPVLETAGKWVEWARSTGAAYILAFDYGALTTQELAQRGGWLRTYANHQRGSNPLTLPGSFDITTDVPIDQLPKPDMICSQAEFLLRWGIDQLVADGKQYWQAHASAPDVTALTMRSRVSEAQALLDPRGLGQWLTLRWDAKHS